MYHHYAKGWSHGIRCVCVRPSVCPLDFLQDGTESAAENCNISIDNTVQVDTQRRDKRRDPRKCVETLTASGVGRIKIAAT